MTDRPTAGRTYSNIVLTVIATLLAVHVMQQGPLSFVHQAQAQTQAVRDLNIPATQDVAVAAATSEVAASNREIAAAIREIAVAVQGLGSSISAAAASNRAMNAANTGTAPAASPSDISISVRP